MHHISPIHKDWTHRRSGQGGLVRLAHTSLLKAYQPYASPEPDATKPRRKSLIAPPDNHTFVKPIKQCFIKNPRLMPMTRIMLTLLSGWAGQGGSIATTVGIIAKHLGRCRRQVFRYLRDAMEEGYLYYTKTKDRIGRYTGIRIGLNFLAIRFNTTRKSKKCRKGAEKLDVTYKSETNGKYLFNKDIDDELRQKLEQFASYAGFEIPQSAPT